MPKDRYHEVCTAREAIHLARIEKLEAALERIAGIETDHRDSEEVRMMHEIATEALN